ncbi:hypothetical protein MMC25_000635 [Agyrium rufum]|nr:hypothetical protein [Agyrium rufum]
MGENHPSVPSSSLSIPTIDLSSFTLHNSTPSSRLAAAQALVSACTTHGFAVLTHTGPSPTLLKEAFAWNARLFSLPASSKALAPHPPGYAVHRGYSAPGLEKVTHKRDITAEDVVSSNGESFRKVEDFKESFEVGSEPNPEQPNIWLPEDVLPGFRTFMEGFYEELRGGAVEVVWEALALGLGLGEEERTWLERVHSGVNNQLRLLHYPPVEREVLERGEAVRMPAHTDWSSFTLLFQDEVGGLEFEDPNDRNAYVKATPVPGTCALNVGDMLQRMTNDLFPSATHRVTLPPLDEQSSMTKARYSIPYFVAPDSKETISCLPSCVSDERPAKFEPVTFKEYGTNVSKYQYRRAA